MTPAVRGLKVGTIAVLPESYDLAGWLVFEQNRANGTIPDVWSGDDVHDPTRRAGS